MQESPEKLTQDVSLPPGRVRGPWVDVVKIISAAIYIAYLFVGFDINDLTKKNPPEQWI